MCARRQRKGKSREEAKILGGERRESGEKKYEEWFFYVQGREEGTKVRKVRNGEGEKRNET